MNLHDYLLKNWEKSQIDHSLRVERHSEEGIHFYLHPTGKDGDTPFFIISPLHLRPELMTADAEGTPVTNQIETTTEQQSHSDSIYELLEEANLGEKHAILTLVIANLETFAVEYTQTTLTPNNSELVKKAYRHIRHINNEEKLALANEILTRISEDDGEDDDDGEGENVDDDDDEPLYITALKERMPLTMGQTKRLLKFLGG